MLQWGFVDWCGSDGFVQSTSISTLGYGNSLQNLKTPTKLIFLTCFL